MPNNFQYIPLVVVMALLAGCSGKELTVYRGTVYQPTDKVATAFQPAQVPKPCRVFAEVLAQLPPNFSGAEVAATIQAEAGKRGADMVLVGQSRLGEDDEGVRFLYYGPQKEYFCADQWGGWNFGYDIWEKQGDWVNIGYDEWGKGSIRFEYPLVMQVVMLRCR